MDTQIGSYDRATRTVPVTFTEGEQVHKRSVNAVLTEAGTYDRTATKARVADVGRGVAVKFGLGVLDIPADDAEQPDA